MSKKCVTIVELLMGLCCSDITLRVPYIRIWKDVVELLRYAYQY
jgi:hypothetical protein